MTIAKHSTYPHCECACYRWEIGMYVLQAQIKFVGCATTFWCQCIGTVSMAMYVLQPQLELACCGFWYHVYQNCVKPMRR